MGGRGSKSKVNRKQKRQNGRMKGGWPKNSSWSKKSLLKEIREGYREGRRIGRKINNVMDRVSEK